MKNEKQNQLNSFARTCLDIAIPVIFFGYIVTLFGYEWKFKTCQNDICTITTFERVWDFGSSKDGAK